MKYKLTFSVCVAILSISLSAFSSLLSTSQNKPTKIIGKWTCEITVPPSTEAYINVLTFTKKGNIRTFLDKNNHSGSWSVKGDSITWIYENVPELNNTFSGKLSEDGLSMSGINFGDWKGESFKGSWKANLQ